MLRKRKIVNNDFFKSYKIKIIHFLFEITQIKIVRPKVEDEKLNIRRDKISPQITVKFTFIEG